ncbi:MAG: efflux RND transporter periplasmic adaptor subunit [Gammaproteobacteria bacterium]
MKRRTIIMVFFIIVILFVTYKFVSGRTGKGNFAFPKPVVTVATVTVSPMPVIVNALGSMMAENEADVTSELSGTVTEVAFEEGTMVDKGMLLVQINDALQASTLAQRQAEEVLANLDYHRLKNLIGKGAISQQEVDKAEANLKVAQANVAFAQAELNKTDIRAPFKGRLDLRNVSPGQYITSGQNLVRIVDKSSLKLRYAVPERFLSQLALDKPVTFHTSAFPDNVFEGKVSFVSPQVDVETRTITVEAHFENPNEALSPGLSGEAMQVLSENPNALSVPEESLVATITGYQVYVIKEDKVASRPVTIGSRTNGRVEILKGLEAGETVVARGQQSLRDGASVEILTEPKGE